MNKNLGLLTLLISLIAVTFYFEEVKRPKDLQDQVSKKRLLAKSFEVTEVKLPNTTLSFTESWRVGELNFLASRKVAGLFNKVLFGLEVLKQLPVSETSEVFQKTKIDFSLSNSTKNIEFTLGDVSEISGHFYLKVDNQTYVVKDTTAYTDVYSSDLDLELKKYLRFKKLIEASADVYIEKELFIKVVLDKFKFAKIDSKRNRWYTIDFIKKTMVPTPFLGLTLKDLESHFKFLLRKVRIKRIISRKQNILTNLVSEIDLGTESETIKAKLYMGLNGNYGRFIRLSNSEKVFEIEEAGSEIFFQPDQTFWIKKFKLPQNVYSQSSFSFALSSNRKLFYLFQVEDVETFKITSSDSNIKSFDKNLMNFTFNLLLNATLFEEAKFISQVTAESHFFSDHFVLSIKIFEKVFHIKIVEDSILVMDENMGLIYHFSGQSTQVTAESYQRIFTPYKN